MKNEIINENNKTIEQAQNYFQRGNFRIALGKYDLAVEDFNQSIKLAPHYSIDVYLHRGIALSELGLNKDAMDNFNYVLKKDPDNTSARQHIARISGENELKL